ncbi:hypothetical protein FisN_15Lh238 [Fistulifera solaris]|uniref:Uncharacterized protein n=1 Tax=Fistulifera solaris TaxID=1519565 RepID=A0A1Z5JBH3_FISSO|nr:hypothetical protein FisN_15Lh238 [Fistulifera solaris]|eukprot:GAX11309.1 hypothetical protein FisN_15Lh238 [Fistulifera solaris]
MYPACLLHTIVESKCAIAFQCYAKMVAEEEHDMTKAGQEARMSALYHDEVERFVNGAEEYEGLFEYEESSSSSQTLTLPFSLHRKRNWIMTVGSNDEAITSQRLRCKSRTSPDTLMSGACLLNYAKTVVANCETAMAYADQYLVQRPRDKTHDYADYILDKMYHDESNHNKKSAERPQNWFFRGFFAFMAWGTLPLNNLWQHRSKFLMRLRKPLVNKISVKRSRQEEEEEVAPVAKKPKVPPNASLQIKRVQTMLLQHDNHQRDLERQEDHLYRHMEHAWQEYAHHYQRAKEKLYKNEEDFNDRRAVYETLKQEWVDFSSSILYPEDVDEDLVIIDSFIRKETRDLDLTQFECGEMAMEDESLLFRFVNILLLRREIFQRAIWFKIHLYSRPTETYWREYVLASDLAKFTSDRSEADAKFLTYEGMHQECKTCTSSLLQQQQEGGFFQEFLNSILEVLKKTAKFTMLGEHTIRCSDTEDLVVTPRSVRKLNSRAVVT